MLHFPISVVTTAAINRVLSYTSVYLPPDWCFDSGTASRRFVWSPRLQRNTCRWSSRPTRIAAPRAQGSLLRPACQSNGTHLNASPHRLGPIRPGHKRHLNRRHCNQDICPRLAQSISRPQPLPCRIGTGSCVARKTLSQSKSRISPATRSVMTSSSARKNQSVSVPPTMTSSSPPSFSTLMVVFNETNGFPTPARRFVMRVA